jgi:hypothetical protein
MLCLNFVLKDIVCPVKTRELARMLENLVSRVFNIWAAFQLSYILDRDVRMVFEFEIIDTLVVGIESFVRGQEAPIWLLRFVKRQPLQVF